MIKKGMVVLLLVFGISGVAHAQSDISDMHQKTAVPNSARYDIIQSELSVRDLPKISNALKPRFLIFTSGLAARYTYLLDTFFGKTWTLTTATVPVKKGEPIKVIYWESFEN